MDKKLKALPEVERVFGKIGRADTSTDPAPLTMIETTVLLQPKSKWRPGMTKDKLVAEMDKAVETIGYVNAWVQPIRARVMMQTTGIQTPVGVKVTGPDIAGHRGVVAADRGAAPRRSRARSRSSRSGFRKATTSTCETICERMAEHGVTVDEAMATVRYAIGGDNIVERQAVRQHHRFR